MEIFWLKNTSPFFSILVRVRVSNFYTLLIGIIKSHHCYYWYFLLRSLVSKIFAGPFHQSKALSSSFTVIPEVKHCPAYISHICFVVFVLFIVSFWTWKISATNRIPNNLKTRCNLIWAFKKGVGQTLTAFYSGLNLQGYWICNSLCKVFQMLAYVWNAMLQPKLTMTIKRRQDFVRHRLHFLWHFIFKPIT